MLKYVLFLYWYNIFVSYYYRYLYLCIIKLCIVFDDCQADAFLPIFMQQLPLSSENVDDPVRQLWVTMKTHKEQLKQKGHTWTTGVWSNEEVEILKANINKYCIVSISKSLSFLKNLRRKWKKSQMINALFIFLLLQFFAVGLNVESVLRWS